MAAAPCFNDLQETQIKLGQQLQTEIRKRVDSEIKFQEQIASIDKKFDKKFDQVTHTLAEIKLQLLNLSNVSGSSDNSVLGCYDMSSGVDKSGNHVHTQLCRFDFPRFDGSNPKAWFLRCSTYFQLMPNIPDVQKIILATKHFDGKALMWYQNFNMGEIELTWKQFLEVVCARFEVMSVSNMMVELNEFKQIGSYDDYVERFEELRAYILLNDSNRCSDNYFIASFMSGLSEELQSFLHLFQPRTLEDTIELGREHIRTMEAISKRMSSDAKPFQNQFPTYREAKQVSPQVSVKMSSATSTMPITKLLTTAEISTRKGKGLFSNCDVKGKGIYDVIRQNPIQGQEFKYSPRLLKIEGCDRSFAVTLEGERGQLKAITTTVDGTKPFLSSLIQKKITNMEEIFVLSSEGKLFSDSSGFWKEIFKFMETRLHHSSPNHPQTEGLNQFLEKYLHCMEMINPRQWLPLTEYCYDTNLSSQICAVSKVLEKSGAGDMLLFMFKSLHHNFLYWSFGKEVVPVLESLEDEAAAFYMIAPFSVLRLQSGLSFVVDEDIAPHCYKKYKSGQKLLEVADDVTRFYKIEPWFVRNPHRVLQKRQEILQMLVSGLKIGPPFAIWENLHHIFRKISSFDPWGQGSFEQRGIVMDLQGLKKKGKVGKEVNLELGISANSEEENGKEDEVLD